MCGSDVLVQSGHQPAVRVWELSENPTQVQELPGHRFGISMVVSNRSAVSLADTCTGTSLLCGHTLLTLRVPVVEHSCIEQINFIWDDNRIPPIVRLLSCKLFAYHCGK